MRIPEEGGVPEWKVHKYGLVIHIMVLHCRAVPDGCPFTCRDGITFSGYLQSRYPAPIHPSTRLSSDELRAPGNYLSPEGVGRMMLCIRYE